MKKKKKKEKFTHPHEKWLSEQPYACELIKKKRLIFEKDYLLIVDTNEKIFYNIPSFQGVVLHRLDLLHTLDALQILYDKRKP